VPQIPDAWRPLRLGSGQASDRLVKAGFRAKLYYRFFTTFRGFVPGGYSFLAGVRIPALAGFLCGNFQKGSCLLSGPL